MFRILLPALLLVCAASAQEVLFTDDFSDGVADGWIELVTGAHYEVVDQCYCISGDPGIDQGSSFNSDGAMGMSKPDYSIYASFTAHDPTHGVLLYVRTNYSEMTGYFFYLRVYQNELRICRYDGTTWYILVQQSDFNLEYDQVYRARFMCVDSSLMAKVWQGEYSDEPTEWDLTVQDDTYVDAGYFGIGAANIGGGTGFDAEFDDILVIGHETDFTAATWASIKASLGYM